MAKAGWHLLAIRCGMARLVAKCSASAVKLSQNQGAEWAVATSGRGWLKKILLDMGKTGEKWGITGHDFGRC